ncbi:MAG: branched-chain amino acid ABC transporter permease [Pseudanabaenaceae cyanobacterium SKYGB_i_bin29]|nr:branched-chain amino acid ABC transporter permease [Pseudanabaenaceae cyanobacterium SKYG29]MDW8421735.1 branched-chain amino acid ABC transporter permease [Pseudanabaenaceae cyanobacterium SKYGB_i_bin29]
MGQVLQALVDGIAVASIMALAGVGLTLTYGILKFANFAHGDLLTWGAYFTLLVTPVVGIYGAIPIGCVLVILLTLAIDRTLWQTLRQQRATPTTMMIASIGLALVLRNLIILVWGSGTQSYGLPIYPGIELFAGVTITPIRLVAIGLAIMAIGAVYYLLQNTKIGWAMRAVADNAELARVSGIAVDRVITWTWVLAGGLTALGGTVYALITALHPNLGWFLVVPLFASVILGGIGNPYGAILGALIIGVAQELGTLLINTQYKPAIGLAIMILVLLFRPQGLFKA